MKTYKTKKLPKPNKEHTKNTSLFCIDQLILAIHLSVVDTLEKNDFPFSQ